jgi:enterochelin esterase family protein
MLVYLPKGYYESDESYPVLYLLHGARGNELSWIEKGDLLHNIDSLTAARSMREMIVVLPNVNQYDDDRDFGKSRIKGAVESLFETDGMVEAAFVSDVVGAVDSLYRTLPDKQHRAIAGLSIGAMQAMHISANAPEVFGYVGAFSAMVHPVLRRSVCSAFYRGFKRKLKLQFATPPVLYSVMIGRTDFYYPRMRCYVRYLERCEYPHQLTITDGGHQWYNWTEFANIFMQQLF